MCLFNYIWVSLLQMNAIQIVSCVQFLRIDHLGSPKSNSVFELIYSFLCAETSTNELPDVISYTAEHSSVFPEISSINRLYCCIQLLDLHGAKNYLGSVLTEDLVEFQCAWQIDSTPQVSKIKSVLMFIILHLNQCDSVRTDSD